MSITTAGFRPIRHDQLRLERIHDTYRLGFKLSEPSVCKVCGAVFHAGRWQWGARPAGAQEVICPACHRIKDDFPAGFVHIGGERFDANRDEMVRLLRHREEKEQAEHPLARIIAIEEDADGVLVTTTDIHLARDLGEALRHAYHGELKYHYNEEKNLLRVHWRN